MKIATLGFVSAVSEFTDKDTKEVVTQVYVGTGEHMIKVTLEEGQFFQELDIVLVSGELGTYDRRVYVNGAKVRLASAEDRSFFSFTVAKPVPSDAPPLSAASVAAAAAAKGGS